MPDAKVLSALVLWRKINGHLCEMERAIIALMQNPDVKVEHLMEAHAKYRGCHEAVVNMQHDLRTKYPGVRAALTGRSIWDRDNLK